MVDPDEREQMAIREAIRPVAERMAEIGWTVPLNELTESQVLTLIEVTVGAYLDALQRLPTPSYPEVPF